MLKLLSLLSLFFLSACFSTEGLETKKDSVEEPSQKVDVAISIPNVIEANTLNIVVDFDQALLSDSSFQWQIDSPNANLKFSPSSGTISLNKNAKQTNLSIQAIDNSNYSGDSSFNFQISSANQSLQINGVGSASFVVQDDEAIPQIELSLASASVAEDASTYNMAIVLSHASEYATQVSYTINTSTVSGPDCSILTNNCSVSSSFTIPAGQSSYNLPIVIVNDTSVESTEILNLEITGAISNSQNMILNSAKKDFALSVLDNDAIAGPNLVISPSSQANMNISSGTSPGSSVVFTLTNSGSASSAVLQAPVFSGDQSNFQLLTDNCVGQTLAAAASCTISIRPIASSNVSYSASFSVSDASATSNSVALSGSASGFAAFPSIASTEYKFGPTDPSTSQAFGVATAIYGNLLVVGSSIDDDYGTNSGSVYLYRLDPTDSLWKLTKLNASDAAANDYFGAAVSAFADRVVVGARTNDDVATDSGSAYVYTYDPDDNIWREVKLLASDAAAYDNFGISVDIYANRIVVGASGDDDVQDNSGAAYIFQFNPNENTWSQTKIFAADRAYYASFGTTLAIYQDTVVVAAPYDDDNGLGTGAVYVFRLDPSDNLWKQNKIKASDASSPRYFGNSLDVYGNRIAVGSLLDSYGGNTSVGAVYVYELDPSDSSWKETKLTVENRYNSMQCGHRVSIYANRILTSCLLDNTKASNAGAVYVFQWSPTTHLWQQTKLTASDGTENDGFGTGLALSGDYIFVGASADSFYGSGVGSVYLYRLQYLENVETKILASDGLAGDRFANEVASDTGIVVAGAHLNDSLASNAGAVYVYVFDSVDNLWKESKLSVSDVNDANVDDNFGRRVSVSGNSILVSATGDDDIATGSGAVYLFRYDPSTNTWLETKFKASDAAASDNYGASVAIDGNTFAVGASGDDDGASGSGSVYVYRLDPSTNTWSETKLTASDFQLSAGLGNTVAISGNLVVSGAFLADGNVTDSGAVYAFRLNPLSNTWNQTKLYASDGALNDYFGLSLAVDGNNIVVGSRFDDDAGNASGSAYWFRFDPATNAWLQTKITASDAAETDRFGEDVDIFGNYIVVSSILDDDSATDSGSVYIYRWDPSDYQLKETKITSSGSVSLDSFGMSVSIDSKVLTVGAYGVDTSGTDAGALYMYKLD